MGLICRFNLLALTVAFVIAYTIMEVLSPPKKKRKEEELVISRNGNSARTLKAHRP